MGAYRKLNKRIINSKIVYFIGAGFSKIADYPIMSEFVDKYLIKDLPIRNEIIINAIKEATGSSDLEVTLSVLEKILDTKYSFNLKNYVDIRDKIRQGISYKGPDTNDILKNYESQIIYDLNTTASLIKKKIFQTYRPKKNWIIQILIIFLIIW